MRSLGTERTPMSRAGAEPQRVLVVDDHVLVGESIVNALRSRGFEAVATTATSSGAVLEIAADFKPTVVLLDLKLTGDHDGIELVQPLRQAGARVLILSALTDRPVLAACVEAGADGLVPKTQSFDVFVDQVCAAAAGERVLGVTHEQALLEDLRRARDEEKSRLEPFEALTPRETELLALLMEGCNASAVAERWYVSVATVRSHIRSLLQKLDVHSQLEAVAKAREYGFDPTTTG